LRHAGQVCLRNKLHGGGVGDIVDLEIYRGACSAGQICVFCLAPEYRLQIDSSHRWLNLERTKVGRATKTGAYGFDMSILKSLCALLLRPEAQTHTYWIATLSGAMLLKRSVGKRGLQQQMAGLEMSIIVNIDLLPTYAYFPTPPGTHIISVILSESLREPTTTGFDGLETSITAKRQPPTVYA